MKAYCALLIIFLFSYPFARDNYIFQPQKSFSKKTHLFENLPQKTRSRLFSFLFGENKPLPKADKKAFSDQGLFHLLTPSGLHYSTLVKLPELFLHKGFFLIINIFVFIFLKFHNSFSAISRVVVYKAIKRLLPHNLQAFHFSYIPFLLTFFVDLVCSDFLRSGLSFLFSFLFWGILIFYSSRKLLCLCLLFLSQMIVSSLMQIPFNLISFFSNPFLSSIFILFYIPIIFLSLFYCFIYETSLLGLLVNIFFDLVLFINETFSFLTIKVSLSLCFLFFLFMRRPHMPKKFLCLLLLFPLTQTGISFKSNTSFAYSKTRTTFMPKTLFHITKYTPFGFNINSQSNRCRFRLKNYYWDIRCYKKKPRKIRGKRVTSLSYQK